METKAKEKYIRMPTRKLRRVINEVRGKSVVDAINMLKFMPYFAAKVVEKNIQSAAANAAEKLGVDRSELIVSEIFADEGPTYKRARPRAQGRVYRIEKRTSHLTVTVKVSEELKKKLEEKKKQAKKTKAKSKPAASKTKKAQTKSEEVVEIQEKPAEIIEEAKQEMEQGLTPSETEMQPEIESPVEAETDKPKKKNIKPEVVQQESIVEEKTEEETKQEETEEEKKQED